MFPTILTRDVPITWYEAVNVHGEKLQAVSRIYLLAECRPTTKLEYSLGRG